MPATMDYRTSSVPGKRKSGDLQDPHLASKRFRVDDEARFESEDGSDRGDDGDYIAPKPHSRSQQPRPPSGKLAAPLALVNQSAGKLTSSQRQVARELDRHYRDRVPDAVRNANRYPETASRKPMTMTAVGAGSTSPAKASSHKDSKLDRKAARLAQCQTELLGMMDLFQTTLLEVNESKELIKGHDAEIRRLRKDVSDMKTKLIRNESELADAAQTIVEQDRKLVSIQTQLTLIKSKRKRPYVRKGREIPAPATPKHPVLDKEEDEGEEDDDELSIRPSADRADAPKEPVELPWAQRAPRHRRPFTLHLDHHGKCEVPLYYSAKASRGKIWYKTPEEHEGMKTSENATSANMFQSQCSVNLMFETQLGEEFRGDRRCQHCQDGDVECWRFREDVIDRIRRPATRCARCILDGKKCSLSSHQAKAAVRARESGKAARPAKRAKTPPKRKTLRRISYRALDFHKQPDDEEYARLLAEDEAEDVAREARNGDGKAGSAATRAVGNVEDGEDENEDAVDEERDDETEDDEAMREAENLEDEDEDERLSIAYSESDVSD